jgi:predicted glutamine amidotransferase
MCRLLAYLGSPVPLDELLYQPEHSLIVQSYQPQEMTAGLLNADGFGLGWYHPQRPGEAFTYRHTQPIWNDLNLRSLSRYVESHCVLGNVRSATPGLAVDLSNCQPFQSGPLLFVHNGFIEAFRQTLYRPIRQQLSDFAYQSIHGTTDSEHIFALLLDALGAGPTRPEVPTVDPGAVGPGAADPSADDRGAAMGRSAMHPPVDLPTAVRQTLATLTQLGRQYQTDCSANIVISDGRQMVASRFSTRSPVPSLYWLQTEKSVMIASEPFFKGDWQPLPDRSLLTIHHDLTYHLEHLD